MQGARSEGRKTEQKMMKNVRLRELARDLVKEREKKKDK